MSKWSYRVRTGNPRMPRDAIFVTTDLREAAEEVALDLADAAREGEPIIITVTMESREETAP